MSPSSTHREPHRLADTWRLAIREQSKCDDGSVDASPNPLLRVPAPPPAKEPWSAPRLTRHGDVRELTMGGTAGVFESGQPGTFRP